MFFLICFVLIQVVFYKEREILNRITREYQILQLVLLVLISLSLLDIIFGLIIGYFPLFNFFGRALIIILLVRNLRMVWVNMLYLFYTTRNVFYLLICVIFCFGILGYFLYNYSSDFSSVFKSCYSLFILLTTCNFPDVMLGTFTIKNKSSVFFFIIYIIINYFIIFSLLKSLYYSDFFKVFKDRAKDIIQVIAGETTITLTKSSEINDLLYRLNKKYSLTEEESDTILELLHEGVFHSKEEKKANIELIRSKSLKYEKYEAMINQSVLLKLFRHKYSELVLNFIDLILILFLFIDTDNEPIWIIILQMLWCTVFIFEYGVYIYYMNFRMMVANEIVRTIFFFVNLFTFFLFLILLILKSNGDFSSTIQVIMTISNPLIILRSVRIVLLLNQLEEFKSIFRTVRNMRTIFNSLISTLFSFFFTFTTLSMFLTGGKITKNAFDEMKDIPNSYTLINFNDFGSGFISCFSLTMVNNVNIIARSLSYKCHEAFQAYFATFYFMSTLVILNICQTLLLEMYLIIKNKALGGKN